MRTFYKPKSNKIILDIILRYNLPMTSLTISLNTVITVNLSSGPKKGGVRRSDRPKTSDRDHFNNDPLFLRNPT